MVFLQNTQKNYLDTGSQQVLLEYHLKYKLQVHN